MTGRRRILVVSSVHPPDDPRIRWKLIETLRKGFDVTYVSQGLPSQPMGFEVDVLAGGRVRRSLTAMWRLIRGRFDVAVIHDPELLPGAILARLFRRTIVFDMHENVVAQIRDKRSIPRFARPAVALVVGLTLALAERVMPFTLAEDGYHAALAKPHRVFANYLPAISLEPKSTTPQSGVVYLGDVTEARGAMVLVEAMAGTMLTLHLIGRCRDDFANRLQEKADLIGVDLVLHGFEPHADALASIGHHHLGVSPLLDLPNYHNSLPTKLLEYAAVGLPIVASDLPGSRNVAVDLTGVELVPPGDVVELRAAIVRVAGDESLRSAVAADVERVRSSYRWPAEDVVDFYTSVGR